MGYARLIGRVGPLAIALGVGVAIATTPGIALAEPADGTDNTSADAPKEPPAAQAGDVEQQTQGKDPASEAATTPKVESPGEMNVESSGGAVVAEKTDTSEKTDDGADSVKEHAHAKSRKNRAASAPEDKSDPAPTPRKAATENEAPAKATPAATDPKPDPKPTPAAEPQQVSRMAAAVAAPAPTTSSLAAADAPASRPVAVHDPLTLVANALSNLLSWGHPGATGTAPTAPLESPALWAVMAWTRKQFASPAAKAAATTAEPTQSLMFASVAAVNEPPVASPTTVGTPDQVSGVVSGSVNVTDPEGAPLTYTVATAPTSGSVTVNATGGFSYTPTAAARLKANTTTTADYDNFTVAVSDGVNTPTTVTVTVPVLPAQYSTPTTTTVGNNPYGVAVSPNGTRAYVTNQASNTVSVVNTATNAVVATITVGSAPTAVTVSPDGTRAYVANNNTVSVINTTTNTVTNTITTNGGQAYGIAVSPNGQRVYLTQTGNNRVSVINTATNTVLTTIAVGSTPAGITVSPDNTRVYVANYSSNTVSVINTTTNTVTNTIATGANPFAVTIRPDGQRLYVTNTSAGSVTVINTATNTVAATITGVGTQPWGATISPDGNTLYVAVANDQLKLIDTTTNTLQTTTITVDTAPESNTHVVTISPDGRTLYVSDLADKALRTITLTRGNTAPTAATPTAGTPDPTTGTLTGNLNITDPDGDTLTYTTTTAPTRGTLTLNQNGTYTYTPTPTARQQTTTNPTDTFTIRATDTLGATASTTVTVPIAPAPNRPPQANGAPTIGAPNAVTGVVTGSLNVTDPDGNPLTYTVASQPAGGSVTVTPQGTYTYTPTTAARLAALQAGEPVTNDFAVTVSDGKASIQVTVTGVPVAPLTVNKPPVKAGAPTVVPDSVSGVVSGSVNVTDPEGAPLTYTVATAPTSGSVTVNATGGFSYTPTAAARLKANTTTTADYDNFTVAVSDGVNTPTTVTVTVPVLPAQYSTPTTTTVGNNPYGVAVSPNGTRAYVTNQASNTVSVVNTATNAVVATITVGSAPTAVTVSPDGTRAYVANNNTVSVINTTTNTVTNTITTNGGQAYGIAVSPNGQRVYLTQTGNNRVSVINTATNTVLTTIAVGSTPAGITVSPDNTRVYVANYSSNTVSVINTTTNTVTNTIATGANPFAVTIRPDGQRLYVTNTSAGSVTVINTATNTVAATITGVGTQPWGATISPDGNTLYVAVANDQLKLIDTTTNTLQTTTITVDTAPESNTHVVTISPDGRTLYVSDLADKALRTITLTRGNTAPTAATPTAGTPDPTTGTLTGNLNITDPDGDTLTYTTTTAPTRGTLTLNQNGTYTYTPTPTARQQTTTNPTDTFTIRATDTLGATASTTVTVPIAAPAAANATGYLPFDMSQLPSDKMVFAHYVTWLPVSIDNLPADQDYYTTQYLTPVGEDGSHAEYGGYLRDRPLPRDPIAGDDWRDVDVANEIAAAKSVGIDGFAVDIAAPDIQDEQIQRLLTQAQQAGDFSIMVTADMSGPLGAVTEDEFASQFASYLNSPGAYRLSDGRVVLQAFYAEGKSAEWWGNAIDALHDDYGVDVAFVPTFLDATDNMDDFDSISYGFGNWGGRNPADADPNSTLPGSQVDAVRQAHALGKIWMQPVAFQDSRPRAGQYEEAGNSTLNSNDWQIAIDEGAEWVQLVTWNDYAEGTAMAPSVGHGYRMLDMQAYSIADFKYGATPTITRDALYVTHRTQPSDATSIWPETMPLQPKPGSPDPTDNVEVVVFATAPATVVATIGGVTSTCAVGGGRSVCTFPLREGDVSVSLLRNGTYTAVAKSPYAVTGTPYVSDLEYYVSGGLR